MAKRKEPFGRPTKYRKEFCQLLIEHMAEGLSLESFGGKVHVCKDSLYEWVKKHKDFSDAFGLGKAACQLYWEKLGRDHLYLPHQGGSFNGAMWGLNMANRFGWRSQVDVKQESTNKNIDHKGKDLTQLTDIELAAIYKEKLG